MDTPTIQDRLKCLYREWCDAHPGEHFVEGGLVSEPAYRAAPLRVVWILKEPVDENQHSNWTLPSYFHGVASRKRRPGRTARPLGALTWGVVHDISDYQRARRDQHMGDGLFALGVTNLKKSGGGSRSVWKVIDAEAERTRPLWTEELRIMDPDIILCGGTFWHIARRMHLGHLQTVPDGARYALWTRDNRHTVVVEARHPASWSVSRNAELSRLVTTVRHGRETVATQMAFRQ